MVKTIQAMKKIDEIKRKRQQRFFDRRMAKASAKKKADMENELMKHVDLIPDEKVKTYIQKKKSEKQKRIAARQQPTKSKKAMLIDEDMDMESEESEEEQQKVVQLAKVKAKKTKAIKKWVLSLTIDVN